MTLVNPAQKRRREYLFVLSNPDLEELHKVIAEFRTNHPKLRTCRSGHLA